MSHLGINPVRGGSPPNDSRAKGAKLVITGALVQDVANALAVVDFVKLNSMNIEEVIIMYVTKAIRAIDGENCIIITIQPRCAMDE